MPCNVPSVPLSSTLYWLAGHGPHAHRTAEARVRQDVSSPGSTVGTASSAYAATGAVNWDPDGHKNKDDEALTGPAPTTTTSDGDTDKNADTPSKCTPPRDLNSNCAPCSPTLCLNSELDTSTDAVPAPTSKPPPPLPAKF